jgi:hypothetical protein
MALMTMSTRNRHHLHVRNHDEISMKYVKDI